MAEQLLGAPEPSRRASRWAHDWYSCGGYQTVHVSHMERLTGEGVVLRDTLTFRELRDDERNELAKVNVTGFVVAAGDVIIKVNK